MEYKLTSAADDAWGSGAVVASDPHATTYTAPGLDNGAEYDFRLAVQLTGDSDRGPWAEVSAELEADSDGDGLQDSADAFPDDACASVDSDGDGSPDTVLAAGSTAPGGSAACSAATTLAVDAFPDDGCASVDSDRDGSPDAVIAPGDSDADACTTASSLAMDAFPDDACASVDRDGNGRPDAIIMPGDSDTDACTTASTLTPDEDSDGDGVIDNLDVDDDNDGLIEIASRAELEHIRHNLAGSSYDDEDEDGAGNEGSIIGAPAAATAHCDTAASIEGSAIFLCGYELTADIDLQGTTSTSGADISCDANAWTPIGGCGSDGNCGETNPNDDDPFTAIFEGNGHTISNLCIEALVESPDRHDVLGLFGHLGGATVRNLTIAEIYIESSFALSTSIGAVQNANRLGALAGYVTGDSAILNVVAVDSDDDVDLQGAATEDSQSIGGLVGYLSGGSIAASYATGDADGGDGGIDWVGGLVGYISQGSITASFATGDADGGAGAMDTVGKLIGRQTGGRSFIDPNYASYGFGALSGEESSGIDGAAKPAGVTTAAGLTADNAGSEWSDIVWDFGSATQAPALKYISSYTFDDNDTPTDYSDDSHSYSCVAADLLPIVVDCVNGTLLPGQR